MPNPARSIAGEPVSHALVVDDDEDTLQLMMELVSARGLTVVGARALRDARRHLVTHPPRVMFLDLVLPDGKGTDLLEEAGALAGTEVVLVTGHASIETSIAALRLGAVDYLVKPISPAAVNGILDRLTHLSGLRAAVSGLHEELERSGRFGQMWGRSEPMKRVFAQVSRVGATSVAVLIQGESGTGKELVARAIHDVGRRRTKAFLAINCGAISPHLMESEIFGHEKGSFTGASKQHRGFFERADGGTLFLDEVTEMPLELQVKLLRVLETGTFSRVGSTETQRTDVRLIAATNRVPAQAVAAGKLREDLLYRLDVFPIRLPTLRERKEDVALLAEHFLAEICGTEGQTKRFTPSAHAALQAHDWPGNVRELRNAVQRAFVMSVGSSVDHQWLGIVDADMRRRDSAPSLDFRIGTSMAEVERAVIAATLELHDGHKERTAAQLGVSLKTLYNRLKDCSVDPGVAQRDGGKPLRQR